MHLTAVMYRFSQDFGARRDPVTGSRIPLYVLCSTAVLYARAAALPACLPGASLLYVCLALTRLPANIRHPSLPPSLAGWPRPSLLSCSCFLQFNNASSPAGDNKPETDSPNNSRRPSSPQQIHINSNNNNNNVNGLGRAGEGDWERPEQNSKSISIDGGALASEAAATATAAGRGTEVESWAKKKPSKPPPAAAATAAVGLPAPPLGRRRPLQIMARQPMAASGSSGGSSAAGVDASKVQWPAAADTDENGSGGGSGGGGGGEGEGERSSAKAGAGAGAGPRASSSSTGAASAAASAATATAATVGHFPCSLSEAPAPPSSRPHESWSSSGPCVISCSSSSLPPSLGRGGAGRQLEEHGRDGGDGGDGGGGGGSSSGFEYCSRALRACELYQECTHILMPPAPPLGDGDDDGGGGGGGGSDNAKRRNNGGGGGFATLMHLPEKDGSMAGVEAAAAAAAASKAAGGGSGGDGGSGSGSAAARWGGSNGGFTLDAKPRTYYVVSFGGSGSKMLGGWLSERGKGMVKEVRGTAGVTHGVDGWMSGSTHPMVYVVCWVRSCVVHICSIPVCIMHIYMIYVTNSIAHIIVSVYPYLYHSLVNRV